MQRRLGVLLSTVTVLAGLLTAPPADAARPLPSYVSLAPSVHQLVTVTSDRWSSTRGSLSAWLSTTRLASPIWRASSARIVRGS